MTLWTDRAPFPPHDRCGDISARRHLLLAGLVLAAGLSASLNGAAADTARSVAVTVPGWLGPGSVAEHARSVAGPLAPGLEFRDDYLYKPFRDALPNEDVMTFPWTGALADSLSDSHWVGPSVEGAVERLKTDILGQMARLRVRADQTHSVLFLNIEAHSWGGVLAYLALKDLENNERFTRSGAVHVNLDTLGSPVGCLDEATHRQQILRAPSALSLGDAFSRAGVKRQRVELDPKRVTWRNYTIGEDWIGCAVASLSPDQNIALPHRSGGGDAHSQYYAVSENLRLIAANRSPGAQLLPLAQPRVTLPAATAQVPAVVPQSPPAFEDPGACPFECCTYREWVTTEDTQLRRERYPNSPVALTVRRGERVRGVTGVVITTRPGAARVQQPLLIGGLRAARGEMLSVLTYQGEGFYKASYRGRVGVVQDGSEVEVTAAPESVWWVNIRNGRGQSGWTDQSDHFEKKDACG